MDSICLHMHDTAIRGCCLDIQDIGFPSIIGTAQLSQADSESKQSEQHALSAR